MPAPKQCNPWAYRSWAYGIGKFLLNGGACRVCTVGPLTSRLLPYDNDSSRPVEALTHGHFTNQSNVRVQY